ncbi:hypothetical protein JXQ31_00955 [candidate division KSB1 bacterium]|nr:hypothetical protein [candidate division KSB1 bacterium]
MKNKLIFVIILLLLSSTVYSQQGELSLHLFGSASLPNGDFGKNFDDYTRVTRLSGFRTGEKIGLAETGAGVGAELIAPVWFRGLNWVLSGRIIVNGVNGESALSKYHSQIVGDTTITTNIIKERNIIKSINLEFGRWINIPVMTGFRYDHHFSHKYTLYGSLQAGVNLSKAPSKKATVGLMSFEGVKESVTADDTQFNFARDFGYELGIGFVFYQTYNLGFRYLALSTPRFDGTQNLSEKVFPEINSLKDTILGEDRSISMFIVTLGIQLFR